MDYDEQSLNSAPTMVGGLNGRAGFPSAPQGLPDETSSVSTLTKRGRTTPLGERFRVGDTLLGRYTVLAELGEGGMGVVYKCLDTVGGIEVAVKCLPPELSRSEAEMEGIRENYAIVARLHHSAISGLRQLEKDADFGEYYLVMDLAQGEDLSAILRRRRGAPMAPDEALAILRPLASALDYAHAEKVLHRDVKPGNVKVDGNRVQLLDFGLAAEVRSSMSRVSLRGHAGSSGTPAYMAPEQWEARRQSAATDQYSLAVMAYQMLSGALPFDSDDMELLKGAVLSRPPDPVAELPRAANAALLRGLAKNPADRFSSCQAFVEALARGLDGAVAARRRRVWPWAAALVAALVVGAVLWRTGGTGATGATGEKEVAPSSPVEPAMPVEPVTPVSSPVESIPSVAPVPETSDNPDTPHTPDRPEPPDEPLEALLPEIGEHQTEAERKVREEAERRAETARVEAATKAKEEEERRKAEAESEAKRKAEEARLAKAVTGTVAGERKVISVGSQKIALHWCPPGTFTMGSPATEEGRNDGEMQHRVTLTKGFWMGETEVTQGLWKEIMGSNPSHFKSGDDYPVERVSWEECQEFLRKMNARSPQSGLRWALPTEAQWEYACRAGSLTAYFWGNALNGDKANCDGNNPYGTTRKGTYRQKTTPVRSYEANAWGLYDMHGNVYEWCQDWYGDYPSGAVTNPTGPSFGSDRVNRGGSWYRNARYCRSADRGRSTPSYRGRNLGFRVALSPVQ